MTTDFLPYGRHVIAEEDITAVVEVLRGEWLTTGPKVSQFEEAFAAKVGSRHAVSFSSGTAALHGAAHAANIGPGDEVITTPLTFCATANCVLYQGGMPVFADVQEDTLTIDPEEIAKKVSPRTKAIIPVDYAGHPADLDRVLGIAERHGLVVIQDACHSLGASYHDHAVGSISDMTVFSFHPVKHITTGEGGMVTTNRPDLAQKLRRFRNHGIDTEARERLEIGSWFYDMGDLGFNYRLSDISCALGLSQLGRLEENLATRRDVAHRYSSALAELKVVTLPVERVDTRSAWHLYPVRLDHKDLGFTRDCAFHAMRESGIGVNVHYIPVHYHSYYQRILGIPKGSYPVAERAYDSLLSLPMHHGMVAEDVDRVVAALRNSLFEAAA